MFRRRISSGRPRCTAMDIDRGVRCVVRHGSISSNADLVFLPTGFVNGRIYLPPKRPYLRPALPQGRPPFFAAKVSAATPRVPESEWSWTSR